MCWHQSNLNRWRQEQAIASEVLKDCEAGIYPNNIAFIRGIMDIYSEHGHLYDSAQIRIEYPSRFPLKNCPPDVYLESHRYRWKNTGDSHIESDWRLCLFVPGESGINFSHKNSLANLLAVVHSFLLKQRIYQKRLINTILTGGVARWPGEDRSHGHQGIREAIHALGGVARNDPCPCGSGLKYKKCHKRILCNF